MKTTIFCSTIMSTLFFFSSHPVAMMIVIILQTLIMCINLWLMMNMSWFSFILFLIFLGGIMVLFIYITSLASNEKFNLFFNHTAAQTFFLTFMLTMFWMLINTQTIKQKKMEFTEMIFKIYSNNLMELTLFTMLYLIFTLIVVVKMTSLLKGPLRAK